MMRKAAIATALVLATGWLTHAQAGDRVRIAHTVQVHQANMMVLADYAKKYGVEIEAVPMRRYADQQLALMTNQVDVAVMGYVNIGLMEEKGFRDYRGTGEWFVGANAAYCDVWGRGVNCRVQVLRYRGSTDIGEVLLLGGAALAALRSTLSNRRWL